MLGLVTTLSLASCRSAEEREVGREVTRFAHLINQLRDAPNAHKAVGLTELQRAKCEAHDACQLQQACVSAYALQLQVLRVTEEARGTVAGAGGDKQAALASLIESERDAKRAHELMQRCVELQGEMERKHVAAR